MLLEVLDIHQSFMDFRVTDGDPATPDTVQAVAVPPATEIGFEPQTDTATFEGDRARLGTQEVVLFQRIDLTVGTDRFDEEFLARFLDTPAVNAGLPASVTRRLYMGLQRQDAGLLIASRSIVKAIVDPSTGQSGTRWVAVTIPRLKTRLYEPSNLERGMGHSLRGSSQRTVNDLLDVALPGLATIDAGGCHYFYDILSAV